MLPGTGGYVSRDDASHYWGRPPLGTSLGSHRPGNCFYRDRLPSALGSSTEPRIKRIIDASIGLRGGGSGGGAPFFRDEIVSVRSGGGVHTPTAITETTPYYCAPYAPYLGSLHGSVCAGSIHSGSVARSLVDNRIGLIDPRLLHTTTIGPDTVLDATSTLPSSLVDRIADVGISNPWAVPVSSFVPTTSITAADYTPPPPPVFIPHQERQVPINAAPLPVASTPPRPMESSSGVNTMGGSPKRAPLYPGVLKSPLRQNQLPSGQPLSPARAALFARLATRRSRTSPPKLAYSTRVVKPSVPTPTKPVPKRAPISYAYGRPWLGFSVENKTVQRRGKPIVLDGLFVKEVTANSPAAMAGIRVGDLVLSLNEIRTTTPVEFDDVFAVLGEIGRVIRVELLRAPEQKIYTRLPWKKHILLITVDWAPENDPTKPPTTAATGLTSAINPIAGPPGVVGPLSAASNAVAAVPSMRTKADIRAILSDTIKMGKVSTALLSMMAKGNENAVSISRAEFVSTAFRFLQGNGAPRDLTTIELFPVFDSLDQARTGTLPVSSFPYLVQALMEKLEQCPSIPAL